MDKKNSEPAVTLELALAHSLTEEEYARIVSFLGRTPTYTELGIFSVMWSEHCSYKNSIAELKKLPRTGGRLLASAGEENAGLIDIGDGLAVAFKIESHNHPSAVEPYQGAATGVGGIMRDIFTMGARPIAALNSLRFGDINLPRTKYLAKGIVKGIGDYGNSFGVPTVAGDVFFENCFNENPLVNAMAVGIVKHSEISRAVAKGEGNLVMIVGSSTGRDGIHGATFASEEISEESQSRRPSVQVGDPFTEKLLLEATLEAIRAGLVVGIQDMGAAGITCSTCEMSARGESGMRIDLDKVPTREDNMTGYEIMLSESQERMLLVAKPEDEATLKRIFAKWDLQCEVIGTVTSRKNVSIWKSGQEIADVPANALVLGGGAPVYHREAKEPGYLREVRRFDPRELPEPDDYAEVLMNLLASPNICSRRWITRQYDSMVRTNTIVQATGDAAVVRIKESGKALAMKTDCNPRYVYLNPYRGAQIAVAESARNVVCVGAKPMAITNCLNFGNPYKPEAFWQFREAVRGMGDACRVLETPVTGGNVSFYNESPEGPIYPNPVVGMLGEVLSPHHITTASFKQAADIVLLLGDTQGHIGGSEYLHLQHGLVRGDAPELDLEFEKQLQTACLELIRAGLVHSAHDASDGGLVVALAEGCIIAHVEGMHLGLDLKSQQQVRKDFYLFGEDQSRIIVTIDPSNEAEVRSVCKSHQIPVSAIGKVTSHGFRMEGTFDLPVNALAEVYNSALERRMEVFEVVAI